MFGHLAHQFSFLAQAFSSASGAIDFRIPFGGHRVPSKLDFDLACEADLICDAADHIVVDSKIPGIDGRDSEVNFCGGGKYGGDNEW
jgi:hypothetical protein